MRLRGRVAALAACAALTGTAVAACTFTAVARGPGVPTPGGGHARRAACRLPRLSRPSARPSTRRSR